MYHLHCVVKASETLLGKNEQTESGEGAFFFFECDLVMCCRIWLHGDRERAAWRLLSFLSVRDGNTHGLWGWLPEILWRDLLAQTLQVRDHIGPWPHASKTGVCGGTTWLL